LHWREVVTAHLRAVASATNPQRRVSTAGQRSSSPFGLVDITVNAWSILRRRHQHLAMTSDYNLQARVEPRSGFLLEY